MKKNVIFDMGNVLIHWNPKALVTRLGLSPEDGELLIRELFGSHYWVMLDRGVISEEAVVKAAAANLPQRIHPALTELVMGWWNRPLFPMEGMDEVCRELKENGYRLYLLSNASEKLPVYWNRIPASPYFDGIMFSAAEKLLKPEHEIYEKLFARFELNPAECIFIDDAPANVEGSIHAGMDAIQFRFDLPRLRRELIAAGIRITP